jgi:hypothetical protein
MIKQPALFIKFGLSSICPILWHISLINLTMVSALMNIALVEFIAVLPQSSAIILAILLATSIMMLFMNSGAEIAFFPSGTRTLPT